MTESFRQQDEEQQPFEEAFDDDAWGNVDDDDNNVAYFEETAVRSNPQQQPATVSVASFDEEVLEDEDEDDAIEDVDDDIVDDDDEEEEEEEDNELWEEVVDDDDDDDHDDDEIEMDDVEEDEKPIESRWGGNMDEQRNSQHSIDVHSMDNSASVDFDLGSYVEMSSHASDKVVPEDYEEACRKLIAIVQPNTDPDDMIRRCDLKTLHANLRQQYRRLTRRHPELAGSVNNGDSGGFWDSAITDGNSDENSSNAFFSGGPFHPSDSQNERALDQVPETEWPNDGFDNDPFESTADTWGSIRECATTDDLTFDAANKLPPTTTPRDAPTFEKTEAVTVSTSAFETIESEFQLPPTPPTSNLAKANTDTSKDISDDGSPVVEKWLERNADEPEDYDYACRKLVRIIYGPNDPDHDADAMMRRTSLPDLYRYLKNEYWFKVHTGNLKDGMDRSSHHSNKESPGDDDDDEVRRLNDIEEAELNPEIEAMLQEEKEGQQGSVKANDEGLDDNAVSVHIDSNSIEADDEESIEVSIKSLPTVEVEEVATESNVHEAPGTTEGDEIDTSELPGEGQDCDVLHSIRCHDTTQSYGPLPDKDTASSVELAATFDHKQPQTSAEENDAAEAGSGLQVENDPLVMAEITSMEQEAELLLELQRLKEEEALLFEEEARLREEAMKMQAAQALTQELPSGAVPELDGEASEIKCVSLPSSESSIKADPSKLQNWTCSDDTVADERTQMLERSGLLIREMSSESIMETDEEESDSSDDAEAVIVPSDDDPQGDSKHGNSTATKILPSKRDGDLGDDVEARKKSKMVDSEESGADDLVVEEDTAELLRQERFERYTREYNETLDKQDNGDTIDEDRLYFLELAVRKRLDEELTEDERLKLEQFDAAEKSLDSDEASGRNEDQQDDPNRDRALSVHAAQDCEPVIATDEETEHLTYVPSNEIGARAEDCATGDKDGKSFGQDVEMNSSSHHNKEVPVGSKEGPAEMQWRIGKINEDLTELVQRAEEDELGELFTTEAMVALKIGASKVALSKKHYDSKKGDYIYFPSVAKCVYDYSLIEEAEKHYSNGSGDFPMEYSTALCTIAASHLNGNVDEVDENDEYVMSTAIELDVAGEQFGYSVEAEMRKIMIEDEISTLIMDAEQQELESDFSPETVSALKRAALKVAYIRKYYDSEADKFVYFPSVAKTVYTFALIDEAEKYMVGTDANEIEPEYTSALCTVAASYLTGNVKEVDEEDEFVKASAMDVELSSDESEVVSTTDDSPERDDEMQGSSEDDQESDRSSVDVDETSQSDQAPKTDSDPAPSERDRRKAMIASDFKEIIAETEENEIEGNFDQDMVESLEHAAHKLCYVKKFFDVTNDRFVYFPSVAKTIVDYTLLEAAETTYSPKNDSEFPPEHVSGLRAVAARLIGDEVDETDEYVFNMMVDVVIGTEDPAPVNKETTDLDSAVPSDDHEVLSSLDTPPSLSESKRRSQMISDELGQIIMETEEQELEEPFEEEAMETLKLASRQVAYLKKYYNVFDDQCIYYPSVARSIVDYSLFEAAEEIYFSGEEEFPMEYTAGLRAVAIAKLADDDLDYEYMDALATAVDLEDSSSDKNGAFVDETQECQDAPTVVAAATDDDITSAEDTTAQLDNTKDTEQQSNVIADTDELLPHGDGHLEESHGPTFSKETPVFSSSEDSADITMEEDVDIQHDSPDDNVAVTTRDESRTEPDEVLSAPVGGNDHEHCEENDHDNNGAQRSMTETTLESSVGSGIDPRETGVADQFEIQLKKIQVEEERLNEMSQILEFKRRVDKQKISDDAKALEEMKKLGSRKAAEDAKALEEEIRVAEKKLDEEASLLFEKWQEDKRSVEQALRELRSSHTSELARIEAEILSLDSKRKTEEERIENESKGIEEQRLGDEINYSQKHQAIRAKLATARTTLESERKHYEDEMKSAEAADSDLKDDKARGFFGFGGRNKKQELDREKQKQAKLMELRLREMEVEKEIQDLEAEQAKIKEQAKRREKERVDRQAQLDKDSDELEKTLFSTEERLTELGEERRQLQANFPKKERALLEKKLELQDTRKDDEAWVESEKAQLSVRFQEGREKLIRAAIEQREAERKEEERLNECAAAMKEKWLKEEAAFALDLEGLERSKSELGLSHHSENQNETPSQSKMDSDSTADVESRPFEDELFETRNTQEVEDVSTASIDLQGSHESQLNVVAQASLQSSVLATEHAVLSTQNGELGAGTPDHLVALNQPIVDMADNSSMSSNDIFDPPSAKAETRKPLFSAALKAKEDHLSGSQPELGALSLFERQSTQERGADPSASVPDHLVAMNQPKSLSGYERSSIRELELFSAPQSSHAKVKPLMAAALRAREEAQLAVSLSGLEMLSPDEEKDSRAHFSKSVPDHLIMLNQPTSTDDTNTSIQSAELFDSSGNQHSSTQPILVAALKAKNEVGQSLKSVEIDANSTGASPKELNGSVPDHLVALHQPKATDKNDAASLPPSEVFDSYESGLQGDKRLLTAAIRAKSGESEQVGSFGALREVQETSPNRKPKQSVGQIGILVPDAVPLKENNEAAALGSSEVTKEPDAEDIEPEPACEPDDDDKVSSPERMSWWRSNGRILVAALFNPAMQDEKENLEESLLEHNKLVGQSSAARTSVHFDVTVDDSPASTPTKGVTGESSATPSSSSSLEEKRRKAAEARVRAIAVRSGRQYSSSDENTEAYVSHESKFRQATAFLQQRVKAAEEPTPISPSGNARALEWKIAAEKEPQLDLEEVEAEVVLGTDHLEWWRRNGTRLVAEKLGQASIGTSDTEPTSGSADEQISRKEVLAEKRRKVVEARRGAKTIQQDHEEMDEESESNDNDGDVLKVEELQSPGADDEKKSFREAEARRLAERTQRAREIRLAREVDSLSSAPNPNPFTAEHRSQPEASAGQPLNSEETSKARNVNGEHKLTPPPTLLYPMIRETNRLSGFIRRYENKLESVCKSLLTVASEAGEDGDAMAAKDLPLPMMIDYIHHQDWYKLQSANMDGSFQPQLLFTKREIIQRQESKQAILQEMAKETEKPSDSKAYKVTAVGKALLQMDGPMQADVGRFLAHLDRIENGLTRSVMMARWNDIAHLSGDPQSQRVCDKLDELVSFCLDSHMIQ